LQPSKKTGLRQFRALRITSPVQQITYRFGTVRRTSQHESGRISGQRSYHACDLLQTEAPTMTMQSARNDYYRIERALQFLHAHRREQPDLGRLAQAICLSESQAQRLFTRWAGVSPKRFLQFLGKEEARRLLREQKPTLEVAGTLGLSGSGRLHDLTVSTLAMTPGEIARAGEGLRIRYGHSPTPFGDCLIAFTDRGICHLAFHDPDAAEAARAELHTEWPYATLQQDTPACTRLAERVFGADLTGGQPLALLLRGTNFQITVWEALLRIPQGALLSYAQVATAVGRPAAARAVANAVASNRIGYLIPCHRVIRGLGEFGGYRWGSWRKLALVGRECAAVRSG
jgi:AraC family transcriptional regulator, regulatory protein of adaptative response / methylated-DNA-[protein]-cysteine methyltransferase